MSGPASSILRARGGNSRGNFRGSPQGGGGGALQWHFYRVPPPVRVGLPRALTARPSQAAMEETAVEAEAVTGISVQRGRVVRRRPWRYSLTMPAAVLHIPLWPCSPMSPAATLGWPGLAAGAAKRWRAQGGGRGGGRGRGRGRANSNSALRRGAPFPGTPSMMCVATMSHYACSVLSSSAAQARPMRCGDDTAEGPNQRHAWPVGCPMDSRWFIQLGL
jgi:hypothetical protein